MSKIKSTQTNDEIIKLTTKYVAQTYGRFPIVLTKGKGTQVWDRSGNKYKDFVAGLAVDNLGHCHPEIVKAIREQAGKLLHVSNLYHIEPQSLLAEELCKHSFADKFFFCNSGAEANEAAIKLARRASFDKGYKNRSEIIAMTNSFHGRTLGSMAATGQKKIHHGFSPLPSGFKHVAFNDAEAARKAVTSKTCAIIVEPIQGEGGVNISDKNYLRDLKKICVENDLLLIFDEVQTGFGRTGDLFAYKTFNVKPDVIVLAKALGGGVPIGAIGASNKVMKHFVPGTHAATFGGNPLSCAAALASLKVLTSPGFLDNAKETGEYFKSSLEKLKTKFPVITNVRSRGMMIAATLSQPAAPIVMDCMEKGYLINCVQQNTLRFIPPLIITKKEIDGLIKTLSQSLKKL